MQKSTPSAAETQFSAAAAAATSTQETVSRPSSSSYEGQLQQQQQQSEAVSSREEGSDLPLPQTLCHSSIPSSQKVEEKEEDEMTKSYEDKKQFWEKMSSSSTSSPPPPLGSSAMQKSFSKEESCSVTSSEYEVEKRIPKSESTISSEPDFERKIMRKSESTVSSEYEQHIVRKQESTASSDMSSVPEGPVRDQLVLHNIIPTELTEEEILQQLSPEKKEHFDTFVKPELAESDHTEEKLEEKDIPTHRQEVTIDKEQMVTRQIKGDILESEMEQQEESVMSDRYIEQQKKQSFEEDMQQIEKGFYMSIDRQQEASVSKNKWLLEKKI